jgi:hypothetical protein
MSSSRLELIVQALLTRLQGLPKVSPRIYRSRPVSGKAKTMASI